MWICRHNFAPKPANPHRFFMHRRCNVSLPNGQSAPFLREAVMGLAAHFRHRHMVGATTHRKPASSFVPIELFIGLLLALAIVAFGFVAYFAFASAPIVP
jgi:hypothetical protein